MAIIPALPRSSILREPLTSGRWPPPQTGPTVVHAGALLPEHDCVASDHPSGWQCTPARQTPDGAWEPVDNVVSVDVATGVARAQRDGRALVRQDTGERIPDEGILGERLHVRVEVDHEYVDGVRLFCGCGTEITAEMMVRKPGGAS